MAAGELLADVDLVWSNCRLFNADGSPIDKACTKAQKLFHKLWRKAKLPSDSPAAPGTDALAASHPAAQPSAPDPASGRQAHAANEKEETAEQPAKRRKKHKLQAPSEGTSRLSL